MRTNVLNKGQLASGLPYFFQPLALLALLRELKSRGIHTVVYTGHTLEVLARRPELEVREALELIDLLIDGPVRHVGTC
jgi:hypothetical protein